MNIFWFLLRHISYSATSAAYSSRRGCWLQKQKTTFFLPRRQFTPRELPNNQSGVHEKNARRKNLPSISPALTSSETSLGLRPSTWQPTEKAVPRISRTVPWRDLAMERVRMVRAISTMSSKGMDLLCLMFFSFLRSRGGSLRALMTREEAEGTTETAASVTHCE